LTATQISFANGVSGVRVSFTQPSPPLQNGYRVTVGNGSPTTIQAPPVTVMATGMGVVNIRVEPLSRHYPIPAIQDTVTLNGEDNTLSLNFGHPMHVKCIGKILQ
jgi:hypothetical protein